MQSHCNSSHWQWISFGSDEEFDRNVSQLIAALGTNGVNPSGAGMDKQEEKEYQGVLHSKGSKAHTVRMCSNHASSMMCYTAKSKMCAVGMIVQTKASVSYKYYYMHYCTSPEGFAVEHAIHHQRACVKYYLMSTIHFDFCAASHLDLIVCLIMSDSFQAGSLQREPRQTSKPLATLCQHPHPHVAWSCCRVP